MQDNTCAVFRIRDVYSRYRIQIFFPSRISDPESQIPNPKSRKRGEEKEISCLIFFVVSNFTKLKLYNFEYAGTVKFKLIDKEFKYFLPKKVLLSFQKYGLRIRHPEKTYPGSGSSGKKVWYRKMSIFRTCTLISDKSGGFAAFLPRDQWRIQYKK